MTEIDWICLSDTHFGAENSVLSHLPEDSLTVDPTSPGPVLEELVDCLDDLTGSQRPRRRPTLILNGDIFELALAQDNVAAMVFDRFIDLAFARRDPIFDDTIFYIPGNHDHHVWETARERQFAQYVSQVRRQDPIGPPWHATRLFRRTGDLPLESELLTALIRRRLGRPASVNIVYPNMGIGDPAGSASVIFHHGHFAEPLYRLMSTVKAALFPDQASPRDVWEWEADNFAWIDFFWSTLGRSGDAGEDVGLVYDMLQNRAALAVLTGNLATAVASHAPPVVRWLADPAARIALRKLADALGHRERAKPDELLSGSTRAGLDAYLSGPLLRQLSHERPDAVGRRVQFVFGHTHKPFESLELFGGYPGPVSVFNTGGWVVDTQGTSPLQGAAIVLGDTSCNVASLRMYNQADSQSAYRVRLSAPPGSPANDLEKALASGLDFSQPPWSRFSTAVAAAVDQRHRTLPAIIRRGVALAGGRR